MLETICLYRAYARAKEVYERIDQVPMGDRAALLEQPVMQMVREVDFALSMPDGHPPEH